MNVAIVVEAKIMTADLVSVVWGWMVATLALMHLAMPSEVGDH